MQNASSVLDEREFLPLKKPQVLPSVGWVVDIANNHGSGYFIIFILFIYLFIL
jgi:hypothetical protein